MSPKHRTTRNNLFLVRFWLEDTNGTSDGHERSEDRWGGKVQRAVSGESHEFSDWDALVKTLRAMLAATSPSSMVDGLPETEVNPPTESVKRGEQL
jgi:hypothetical protein